MMGTGMRTAKKMKNTSGRTEDAATSGTRTDTITMIWSNRTASDRHKCKNNMSRHTMTARRRPSCQTRRMSRLLPPPRRSRRRTHKKGNSTTIFLKHKKILYKQGKRHQYTELDIVWLKTLRSSFINASLLPQGRFYTTTKLPLWDSTQP